MEGECCPEAVSDATAYVPIASNIIADLVSRIHMYFKIESNDY